MKFISPILILAVVLFSCNNSNQETVKQVEPEKPEVSNFFPVTEYIKGQLADIRTQGINPKKFSIVNKKEDSSWLKIEELDAEAEPFLKPVIDSNSLSGIFTEKKFLDQTINAFTFTYDPVKPLPDSFLLQHLDVYVDPKTNSVTRIYILKKTIDHKTLQLTWQADKWCKIVTIADDGKGNDFVEKEVTIKWDF